MEGVVALLFTKDSFAVLGVVFALGRIPLVFSVKLRQANGEGEEHQQEQAQELSKLLKHLTHRDLRKQTSAHTQFQHFH